MNTPESAFPQISTEIGYAFDEGRNEQYTYPDISSTRGMTLRDYFAAKAMVAVLANPPADSSPQLVASISYDMARYMLLEREKQP